MLWQMLNHLNISSDLGTIGTLRMRVSWGEGLGKDAWTAPVPAKQTGADAEW